MADLLRLLKDIKPDIWEGAIIAAMVDGMIAGIRRELGYVCPVIGAGGLVDLVGPHCRTIDKIEPLLTLDGLKRIWELNPAT